MLKPILSRLSLACLSSNLAAAGPQWWRELRLGSPRKLGDFWVSQNLGAQPQNNEAQPQNFEAQLQNIEAQPQNPEA